MIPISGFQISVLRKLQTIYDLIVSSPPGAAVWGTITGTLSSQTDLQTALNAKQDTLVSGTNIKTINGSSVLGSGDLTITGGIPKATATGTDTYVATITGVTAYNDGDAYLIRFTNGNTTESTLNINTLGAVTLYRNNDGPIVPGDILAGAEMLCVYNSTTPSFQCIGTSPNTLLSYVTNDDTVTINKGQPVYASGGVGDRLKVKLASNLSDATSAQTIGLVFSTSIAAGQQGIIIMQGLLTGLNILPTSTWADSDPVYLGATAGSITKTKPYAPNHLVYLGFVTSASNGNAGRLYVRVQNGYELDELHNVQAQSPSLKDTLYYDNTVSPAQWKTASIVTILGYTPYNGSTNPNGYITSSALSGYLTSAAAASTYYPLTNPSSYITSSALSPYLTSATAASTYQTILAAASGSSNGYLTSTDWTTFNNKQNTLVSGTNIKSINGDSILGSGNELVFNYDRAKFGFEAFTDFLSAITANNGIDSAYTAFFSGTGTSIAIGSLPSVRATNQQGFIQPATGTTASGYAGIYGTTNGNNFFAFGGGVFNFTTSIFIPNLSTVTDRYRIVLGFGTSALNVSDPSGVFFTYDEGGIQNGTSPSPNWQCVTSVSNVRTLTTTSVLANTSAWQKFDIEINATGTSVDFYIDNVLVAMHTTNIPTGISFLVTSKIQIAKSIGTTSRTFFADYFGYKQTYTTAKT